MTKKFILAVPLLLSNLQFDLSYTAVELSKLLAAPLVSKTESLELSALASFRALAKQISNGEIIINIVQYLFNIHNGLKVEIVVHIKNFVFN